MALSVALLVAGCGQERRAPPGFGAAAAGESQPRARPTGFKRRDKPAPVMAGDAERGAEAIRRYGCVGCHSIPGVGGYQANVGPPLFGLHERGYIGGVLANTPENLVKWLRDPPGVDPRTAMPDLGVSEGDAWDIAAYLYEHT